MTSDAAPGSPSPCPACGQPVWPGDNFCEACRAELNWTAGGSPAPEAGASAGPQPPTAVPPTAVPPTAVPPTAVAAGGTAAACTGCGATSFSADGYCESCGRKMPSGRDHAETNLGQLAGITDRGLRHYRNEDAMAMAVVEAAGGPVSIAVVCDGVSGSDRGDEAALAGTEAALAALKTCTLAGEAPAAASRRAVEAAQAAVAGLSSADAGRRALQNAPSATFVSAVLTAEAVTVCWLGDSRAYWLDAGLSSAARQLTTDDSLATELVTAGVLSADEAMQSAQAHVVTGWLGADVSEREPRVMSFAPDGAGVVLLCSDGLWNYLPDPERLAERAQEPARRDPLGAARGLVNFALEAGGQDNITVVIAPFPPAGSKAPASASHDITQPAVKENDDE